MSRRTYAAALDEVLKPEGFAREGPDWVRERDGFRDEVNLQTSTIAGTTCNLRAFDLELDRLYREAVGASFPRGYQRIGILIDGYDRWWRRDPNGPNELSAAVRQYGLPYLEAQRQSLEEYTLKLGPVTPRWGSVPYRICHAILLNRMGRVEEACFALANPPRLTPESWLEDVRAARRWIGCPEDGADQ